LTELEIPAFSKDLNGYALYWPSIDITMKCERVSDDAKGELVVIHDNGIGTKELLRTSVNLMSLPTMDKIATRLLKNSKDIDWQAALQYCTKLVVSALREGGIQENINQEPKIMRIPLLIDPIIPLNMPTTIFSAGGKGKSTIADYFAILVQFGICADGNLPFVPMQANVLYLDWEADADTHRRYITAIKRGLHIDNDEPILYRQMSNPLINSVEYVRSQVAQFDIGFIIIDSVMAATATSGHGQSESTIASEFYNCLNSFRCTSLSIDHITKSDMSSNQATAPFGSVSKFNRSRAQYELKSDEDDSDHKEYALVSKKFNPGRSRKPIGMAVDFYNDSDDTLQSIRFSACDIGSNNDLAERVLTKRQRIINILQSEGTAAIKDIAEMLNEPDNTKSIGVILAKDKKTFVKIGTGKYGLLENF